MFQERNLGPARTNLYLVLPQTVLSRSGQQIQVLYVYLGDNCTQIFHLERYIVGYAVGLVLRQCASSAVKHDFRTFIRRNTSPNENFEYGYHHSNAHLQFPLKLKRCNPH